MAVRVVADPVTAWCGLAQPGVHQFVDQALVDRQQQEPVAQQPEQGDRQAADALGGESVLLDETLARRRFWPRWTAW
jgi:hypothetical protein